MNCVAENTHGEPLLSVVVPVYNTGVFLRNCIDSLLMQAYAQIEILVIDDGSTDDSPEISLEYEKRYPNLRVVRQPNMGLSEARNTGIKHAEGRFIAFVDSDDYIDPGMYQSLMNALEHSNASIAMCGIKKRDVNGREILPRPAMPLKEGFNSPKDAITAMFEHEDGWSIVPAWNKVYKRSLFEEIEYPPGKMHEDEFVIVDLLLASDGIEVVRSSFYNYVIRPGSIMNSGKKIAALDCLEARSHQYRMCKKAGYVEVLPAIKKRVKREYYKMLLVKLDANLRKKERVKEVEKMIDAEGIRPGKRGILRSFVTVAVIAAKSLKKRDNSSD